MVETRVKKHSWGDDTAKEFLKRDSRKKTFETAKFVRPNKRPELVAREEHTGTKVEPSQGTNLGVARMLFRERADLGPNKGYTKKENVTVAHRMWVSGGRGRVGIGPEVRWTLPYAVNPKKENGAGDLQKRERKFPKEKKTRPHHPAYNRVGELGEDRSVREAKKTFVCNIEKLKPQLKNEKKVSEGCVVGDKRSTRG